MTDQDRALCANVVDRVDARAPGLLPLVAEEDRITKEQVVEKVLRISRGEMVCTHHFGACLALPQGVFVIHGRCDTVA